MPRGCPVMARAMRARPKAQPELRRPAIASSSHGPGSVLSPALCARRARHPDALLQTLRGPPAGSSVHSGTVNSRRRLPGLPERFVPIRSPLAGKLGRGGMDGGQAGSPAGARTGSARESDLRRDRMNGAGGEVARDSRDPRSAREGLGLGRTRPRPPFRPGPGGPRAHEDSGGGGWGRPGTRERVGRGRTVPPPSWPGRAAALLLLGRWGDPSSLHRRAWSSLPSPGLRSLRPVPWTRTGRSSLAWLPSPRASSAVRSPC
ncbi:unnamed protein product [Rangifer tarandus platyrhynchus]|uniref:Uncharacterized protein n=1 Tax=Rangifer tarandus platyrhynchus TaxID=3082113 RepID=A0ABN8Z975_RANTA|nr:unnamed protein product [Rangifer tarandus platyrhynchus]CAI9688757.1 unnamed protein product [Rangifer tarandus platyrhynchus]